MLQILYDSNHNIIDNLKTNAAESYTKHDKNQTKTINLLPI